MNIRSHYALLYLLVIPLLGLIYVSINQEPQHINTLYTDLDREIPFVKAFIIPYMIWMPFLYLTLVYYHRVDRRLYYRMLAAYTVSVLICYVIYLVFQTTVPRPLITESDMLSKFVMFVYRNDAPFNCFPSIHCLSSYLLFRAALTSPSVGRIPRIIISLISWSIIVSTLFVKQHVLLDMVAAIVLGHVIYTLIHMVTRSRIVQKINNEVNVS